MTATKVLVIDDSITMRALFTNALERNKGLVVVGSANGADEAREMIAELKPDVLTLDVEMPGKNGLEFLEEIMETKPMPVVMLSTLTQKGSDVTIRALELGAVDCLPKPARATPDEFEKISGKLGKVVMTAAKTNLAARKAGPAVPAAPVSDGSYAWDGSVVVISGGMGGIDAATDMLSTFPANCPPTILLLAVDEGFGVPLASKLSRTIAPKVKLAGDGEELQPGHVYVAVDPNHHVVVDKWPNGRIRLIAREAVNGCRPSADLLLASVAKTAGVLATGVLLSGGGADGAAGLATLRAAQGMCLAQDPETALVRERIDIATQKGAIASFSAPEALTGAALRMVAGKMAA